ncbi:MAG: SIMPL domain-containing protein, partial [Myxococcales bacterium]|nr:SIMPL domain-containing protein [Myxococcales bacterium]
AAHPPGTLTVTGIGLVEVEPDEAVIHLSIITEARTAVAASQNNATLTEAVVAAVSAQPNHGVTTGGLSVRPITNYEGGRPTIVGFRATHEVVVRTKVGYAGQIFDAGISAGANESSGIEFRRQDEGPQRERALQVAVEQALRDATIVASAAGVGLDGPESIEVEPGRGALVPDRTVRVAAAETPVIPAALTLSATVRVVFRTRCR